MDGARVYEEKTVIHELTQGKQMAKKLRVNLHSPEARELLIKKILSSYEKALFLLKARDSAWQPPEPAIPGSEEFWLDQPFTMQQGTNDINKKRKMSTTWEDQVKICSDNGLEGNTDEEFEIAYNGEHTCDYGALLAAPPPPPSPEKHEIAPGEHTTVLGGDTAPSSNSFPSTSPGLMEDLHRFQFPNQYYDELLLVYSPPLISPESMWYM